MQALMYAGAMHAYAAVYHYIELYCNAGVYGVQHGHTAHSYR
jgi:hypothetical protein